MPIYSLIDADTHEVTYDFETKTPRDAALKAAIRNVKNIYIVDFTTKKIHVFNGWIRELHDSEKNRYRERHNILSKPMVSKVFASTITTDNPKEIMSEVQMQIDQVSAK